MFEAFGDQLGADAILKRMYATANKSGIYANAYIYGQGLLDIGAATTPFGESNLRTSLGRARASVREAARFDIGESRIALGPAFGDALSRALAGREAVFFDSLDTGFAFPAADFATTPPRFARNPLHMLRNPATGTQGDIFEQRGKRHALAMTLGRDRPFHTGASDFARAPRRRDYAELARDGYSLGVRMDIAHAHRISASVFTGRTRETHNFAQDTHGAYIAYGILGDTYTLSFETGYLNESDRILGASAEGAFAHEGETPTFFAGVKGVYELAPNWEGMVHARMGRTEPDALGIAQSGLHDITPLSSSAFSAGLYRRNVFAQGDALGFILAQPLRIENGSAELTYATGRTRAGQLLEETLNIPLTPSGRALELEAVYQGKHIELTAGTTLNARHEKGRSEAYMAVRASKRF